MAYVNVTERPPQTHVAESDAVLNPLGVVQTSSLSASTAAGLPATIPSTAKFALINVLTQNLRWRDDGADPTTSVGMQIEAGKDFWYTGDLSTFKMISEIANAEVNVAYYGYA